jgi:hypothetical protein
MRWRLLLICLAGAWVAALAAGQHWLLRYKTSAGDGGSPPAQWPAESALRPTAGRFTLVVFVHPHCPCSTASIAELAWIMARHSRQLTAYVVFCKPVGSPDDWTNTGLWRDAAIIPGARLFADDEARETNRFHAETSGQALLYDTRGQLVFRGGITPMRGHTGEGPGRSTIVACLSGRPAEQPETPVYGCPLFDPKGACSEGETTWSP